MPRPSAITWLLLLLVLLPSGALAALGFRAADAYDASDATRVRADMATARRRLGQAAATESERLRQRIETAVRAEADRIAARASPDAASDVGSNLAAEGLAGGTAILVDASGHSLWPVEFVPPETQNGSAGPPTTTSLLTYLRRSADRAFYGDGGPSAAQAVWQEARSRFHSRSLRRLADVELARLRVRISGAPGAAARELKRLRTLWDAEGRGPVWDPTLGRPLLLLQMLAAETDAAVRRDLAEHVRSGRAAQTPLTVEERRRLRLRVRAAGAGLSPGATPDPLPGSEPVRFPAPVAHGAQLEVRIPFRTLLHLLERALLDASQDGSLGPVRMALTVVGAPDPGLAPGFPDAVETLRILLPGDTPARLHFVHDELAAIGTRKRQRRWLMTFGVLFLFSATLLGLALTRRAMARERAAQRLRDEFIANVTHEVRTPLTSVLLHSEILAEETTDETRRREHAQIVRAQGRRLAQLVDDMLDFTALERGTRSLESVPVDLGAACREAAAPYGILAEREGVDLQCDVASDEVAGMADPAALARVLANLLGNAWKHGRPSRDGAQGRIRILAVEAAEADGGPTVEVRDDGPGVPREERDRIFARFGRGRGAAQKEGAGIGLSLSRDLARAMGGELDVREEAGETVFRLRLAPVPELEV